MGEACIYGQDTEVVGKSVITVNGGLFENYSANTGLFSWASEEDTTIRILGGTFFEDVTSYVKNANSVSKQGDDGKWRVICKVHTPVAGNALAATCTEDGRTAGSTCSVCKEVLNPQEAIPASGHSFGSWSVVRPATAQAAGQEQRICANDRTHIENREIPKLGSGDAGSGDGDGVKEPDFVGPIQVEYGANKSDEDVIREAEAKRKEFAKLANARGGAGTGGGASDGARSPWENPTPMAETPADQKPGAPSATDNKAPAANEALKGGGDNLSQSNDADGSQSRPKGFLDMLASSAVLPVAIAGAVIGVAGFLIFFVLRRRNGS